MTFQPTTLAKQEISTHFNCFVLTEHTGNEEWGSEMHIYAKKYHDITEDLDFNFYFKVFSGVLKQTKKVSELCKLFQKKWKNFRIFLTKTPTVLKVFGQTVTAAHRGKRTLGVAS
jgi:hypothetical protein